jgi:hypothetical protein
MGGSEMLLRVEDGVGWWGGREEEEARRRRV